MRVLIYLFLTLALNVSGQHSTNSQSSHDLVKLTSQQRFQQMTFTTPAYRIEALRLVIAEANRVAEELNLPEQLPILETNLVAVYIPPPQMAQRLGGGLGNITTSNYTYYVSIGNKFSFLEQKHLDQGYNQLRTKYLWPISRMDTNAAFRAATQFLAAASMDVKSLNKDCNIHIEAFIPEGENGKYFVPVYWVYWLSKDPAVRGSVAGVEFIEPTKIICQMRVNKSEYILRQPLTVTNLDFLLSQTNVSEKVNAP